MHMLSNSLPYPPNKYMEYSNLPTTASQWWLTPLLVVHVAGGSCGWWIELPQVRLDTYRSQTMQALGTVYVWNVNDFLRSH